MMQDVKTVNDAFLKVAGRGDKTAWLSQDASGAWKAISAAEVYGRVRALATALAGWGVGKGDRVALLSENRWEWPVVDFATLALGAVDVPLYMTLTSEQVGYMLRDSGAKVAIVSSREQYDKICATAELPALEHVVVMEEGEFGAAKSFSSLLARSSELQVRDAEFDAKAREVQPEDLATIIYTSGTTGEPKGVMLTHDNLASNFTLSTVPFGFGERDVCISFLPLSHVTARHLDYALMINGVTLAYCPKIDMLRHAMEAVRPTIFVAVPRVYEKIRQGVEGKSHGLKKRILNWALHVGKTHRSETFAGKIPAGAKWKLADKLVFSKIRTAFGGRVETFVSGGAPLGMDTAGWFADVGIRILEGYGLTETSPVIALNTREKYRMGSVGPILANVQVRLAADGELEVRGPSVFRGYWNKPNETAEAFTPDGWLRTGDIASLDADGFLYITDRKKELLKTSGGKLIAPQPIENKLKARALIGNAALVGDKHKFACAIISPNFAALESWAKVKGVTFNDRGDLMRNGRVIARYQRIVDEVNATLAPFETIKRLALVPDEWSVETDELTPSMKLKRRVVEKKYAPQIAEFYKDEATATK
ncbi:MAG TPA: long-chain fatty acid--CoA ligase [Acidobacteriaceae bacterium]|jgi:long-chain acyl-CoA synthetase|nr:long-chain fatty acid--CoA ligase [Acidobacteriaceae bacterium]